MEKQKMLRPAVTARSRCGVSKRSAANGAMKPNGGTVKDGVFYRRNLRNWRKTGACAAALQNHRPEKFKIKNRLN